MAVVLGYDESPGAARALSTAIELARVFDEPLVLVHGIAPPGGAGEELIVHQQALADIGRRAIDHAVADADAAGVRTDVRLVPSKPVDALLDAAEASDARMIVVGTWGESPIRGAMLGSVPHKLLHLSGRPVLCVPADERA